MKNQVAANIHQMKIQDNFLPQEQYEQIRETMMSTYFPWFYNSSIIYGIDHDNDISDRGQMVHCFFRVNEEKQKEVSTHFELIVPLLNKLEVDKIFRVKANLRLRTDISEKSGWHVDGFAPCTTSIYYINSNDGVTEFEDGSLVDTVANRMVSFNGKMKHRGCTQTNTKTRVLINLNYL